MIWKSLYFYISASLFAVPEIPFISCIVSSCNFKHLFFKIPTDPQLRFNPGNFMFLPIFLNCIKFYFLEENYLGCSDIWQAVSAQAAPCWASGYSYSSYMTPLSSSYQMSHCFSLKIIAVALRI